MLHHLLQISDLAQFFQFARQLILSVTVQLDIATELIPEWIFCCCKFLIDLIGVLIAADEECIKPKRPFLQRTFSIVEQQYPA